MDSKDFFRSVRLIKFAVFAICVTSCNVSDSSSARGQSLGTENETSNNPAQIHTLNKAELIKNYGAPLLCDTFLLNEGVNEFRIELYNIYHSEYLELNKVKIEENTWAIDSIYNLTVWYRIEDSNESSIPVDSCIWNNELEF